MGKNKNKVIGESEESDRWLRQAERDLNTARNSFGSGDYYASVFWCQQVAEKGIKALMIKEGRGLVRIHDLVKLGREVSLPDEFFDVSAKLSVLYSSVRYPIYRDIDKEEVDSFIKFAEEVLRWIKKKI